MLDIETLGHGPGVVVLSVAIVPFHINGKEVDTIIPSFYNKISLGDSVINGFKIQPETLEWWLKNDKTVIQNTFDGILSVKEVCYNLSDYINEIESVSKEYRIWASAPKLDFGCFYSLYRDVDINYPIKYSSERCYRTIRELAEVMNPQAVKKVRGSTSNSHDALEDCKLQIINLQTYYKAIRNIEPKVTIGDTKIKTKDDIMYGTNSQV